jgi:hypothetical protein
LSYRYLKSRCSSELVLNEGLADGDYSLRKLDKPVTCERVFCSAIRRNTLVKLEVDSKRFIACLDENLQKIKNSSEKSANNPCQSCSLKKLEAAKV